jgi:hypothetical protein
MGDCRWRRGCRRCARKRCASWRTIRSVTCAGNSVRLVVAARAAGAQVGGGDDRRKVANAREIQRGQALFSSGHVGLGQALPQLCHRNARTAKGQPTSSRQRRFAVSTSPSGTGESAAVYRRAGLAGKAGFVAGVLAVQEQTNGSATAETKRPSSRTTAAQLVAAIGTATSSDESPKCYGRTPARP